MDKSSEILVEIPPPEVPPAETSTWGLAAVSVAMIAGVVVFALATAPRIPAFEWQQLAGPEGVNLDSMVVTDEGFAMLSGMTADGVLLWSSDDGLEWESRPLRDAPTQLAALDDGLLAYGDITGHRIQRAGGTWLETEVDIVLPDEIRSRQGSGRASIVATSPGLLAMSIMGDVWWSSNEVDFELVVGEPEWGTGTEVGHAFDSACRPPSRTSPDVPPMITTDTGLITMISSNPAEPFGIWPVCEPQIWTSEDGRTWSATDSRIGDGAYVYDVAWRDGRLTAVGGYGIGEPAVWTSTDGIGWESLPTFPHGEETDLYTVVSGAGAWVVLGQTGEQSNPVGWTSLDGLCWESLPLGMGGSDAAVDAESVLVLDRTTYPEFWHGSVTGGTGSC